ncbi:MAG: CGLD27 family protein, partial [Cyanobacteria bacterium J06632_3]
LTFSMPLASTSINWWKNPITFISLSIGISSLLVILVLLRTYLGWSYISKRLLSATIVYEESGWYDGEIWIKTPLELVQDRLVAQYTIKPILRRIQYSTQILIVIFIGSISYIV